MARACCSNARQKRMSRARRRKQEHKALAQRRAAKALAHATLRSLAGAIVLQPTVRRRSLRLMRAGATPRIALRPAVVSPTPLRLLGAGSTGALAVGAMSLGAGAIGALAIGRIAIKRGVIGSLKIDELKVRSLEVEELSVQRGSQPSGPPAH